MILSKTFTIETRLNQRDNAEILEYAKEYNVLYGKMLRFTWHRYNNGGTFNMQKSKFNTILQRTFDVNRRLASSVISEVEGLYKALYQLKWVEFFQLKAKIAKKHKKYEKLQQKVYVLKEKAKSNSLSAGQLSYYRKLKADLFHAKQTLNRMNRSLKNRLVVLNSRKLEICFGSKKLFLAQYHLAENHMTSHKIWYEAFCKHRDNRALYIGSKDEQRGNQLIQLVPMVNVGKGNSYAIQIRKNTKKREYVRGSCNFKHMGGQLAKLIVDKAHGITYRIKFRGKKCYLQATVTIDRDSKDCQTRSTFGTIGLDYNDGFIEMAETNETGNLIKLKHIDLEYHGTGNKAENEIRKVVSDIVNYAVSVGKDIVIEDLNFKKTKAETEVAKSDKGKDYNKMIHLFDYSRYKSTFEGCCYLRNVNLIKVNPAYTSKIAGQKYCNQRKLVIHQGASFVIARKGQGFVDKYIKPKKKEAA
jgi:transposase, IS605 orfB family